MKKLALLFMLVGTLLSFNFSTEAKESNSDKNNLVVGKVELNNVVQTYYVYRQRYYRPRYRRIYRYRTYRTVRYVPRYRYRTYGYRSIYIPRIRYRRYYRPVRYRVYYTPRYRTYRRVYYRY